MNFQRSSGAQRFAMRPRFVELVHAKARELHVPVQLALFGVVNALTIATNLKKARVTSDGKRWQTPILMTMAVASSAMGKSPALWTALKPVLDHDAKAAQTLGDKTRQYWARLALWNRRLKALQREADAATEGGCNAAAALATHLRQYPVRPVSTRILFTNATHSALVDHASLGGHIALVLDDAHGVRRAGVLDGRLSAWYAALPMSEDTRTHGSIEASEPRLTVAVAIQRSELRRFLRANDGSFRFSGMSCRFLVFSAEDDYGWRDQTSPDVIDLGVIEGFEKWFAQRLEQYASSGGACDSVDMRLSTEALFDLESWRARCEHEAGLGGSLSDVPDAARKAYDHAIRLAACIEDFETGNSVVGLHAMRMAIEVVQACLANFDVVMGCAESATILGHRAPRLLRWLMTKLPFGQALPEKLLRAGCFHEICPKEYWEPVILALEAQKYVLRRKGFIALNHASLLVGGTLPQVVTPKTKGS